MNYNPKQYPLFTSYLEALDQCLNNRSVSEDERQDLIQELIQAFEAAMQGTNEFSEEAYIAKLEDPEEFANKWPSGTRRENKRSGYGELPIKWIALLILLLAAVGIATFGIQTYNRIVTLDSSIESNWAQVETQLQRRFDLIPNLVSTVKGYASHENETFVEVAKLRSQWGETQEPSAKIGLANLLNTKMSQIVALSENYPALRASEQFTTLMYQLEGTENRIAVARTRYNETLRNYNATVRRFPAKLFLFPVKDSFFEAQVAAKTAPKVQF